MISFHPIKEEIPKDSRDKVREWILGQAAGERPGWPGYVTTAWVEGYPLMFVNGAWDIRPANKQILVGNAPGVPTPLWVPSLLMATARFWGLEEEANLVKEIQESLARILARSAVPVMTSLAQGFNGRPIQEIAINDKEKLVAGRYPGPDGKPGPFRFFSGEVAAVEGPDWIRMRM